MAWKIAKRRLNFVKEEGRGEEEEEKIDFDANNYCTTTKKKKKEKNREKLIGTNILLYSIYIWKLEIMDIYCYQTDRCYT